MSTEIDREMIELALNDLIAMGLLTRTEDLDQYGYRVCTKTEKAWAIGEDAFGEAFKIVLVKHGLSSTALGRKDGEMEQ